MAEIQRKIVKRGKRNAASRLVHAKNDKETIATWRSDLARILLVFNVRSVVFTWLVLIVHSQTELAINTHVTVFDIRHDVASTHTIVSNVHYDVLDTHAIVSDVRHGVANTHDVVSELHHEVADTHAIVSSIHRTVGKIQEGTYSQNLSVSITRALITAERTLTAA